MRHPIIKHGAVTAPLERKSPFLSVSVAGLPGCGRARAGDSRSPAEQRQDHDGVEAIRLSRGALVLGLDRLSSRVIARWECAPKRCLR